MKCYENQWKKIHDFGKMTKFLKINHQLAQKRNMSGDK